MFTDDIKVLKFGLENPALPIILYAYQETSSIYVCL